MAATHVELDRAGEFDDGLGVMAVLGECVFDGLGAIDEEPAIAAVLFLGDPLPAVVLADEDERESSRAARGRFDKLHVSVLPKIEFRISLRDCEPMRQDIFGAG
jgi:hypothetical protein